MKKTKLAIIAVAALLVAVLAGCGQPSTQLVPAWQVFSKAGYRGVLVRDPVLSWAPDSKSLLTFGVTYNNQHDLILRWKVGDSKVEQVAKGLTPNYINGNEFIFFSQDPKGIFRKNLKTGEQKEIMAPVKKSEFWDEAEGISYNSETKTVGLRLTEYTPRYLFGTEEFDLEGKSLGPVTDESGPDVLEWSESPNGKQRAVLVQEESGQPVLLEIAEKGKDHGKQLDSGSLYGVAWSPVDDDAVAYGDDKEVLIARPSNGKRVVVGRFGDNEDTTDGSYVTRVRWSPDGKYLAVLYYVSADQGDYPLLYILDMTKFKWDR